MFGWRNWEYGLDGTITPLMRVPLATNGPHLSTSHFFSFFFLFFSLPYLLPQPVRPGILCSRAAAGCLLAGAAPHPPSPPPAAAGSTRGAASGPRRGAALGAELGRSLLSSASGATGGGGRRGRRRRVLTERTEEARTGAGWLRPPVFGGRGKSASRGNIPFWSQPNPLLFYPNNRGDGSAPT